MAREIERRSRAAPDQNGSDMDRDLDHPVDPAALLAELLVQNAGPATVVTGPEWTTQFRPPSIPGTVNDKYVTVMLPLRAVGYFLMWLTWNWKYGAFVGLVLGLVVILIKTRG